MPPLVTVELLDRWDRVPVGEVVPLQFVVSRPEGQPGAVAIPAAGITCPDATLNTDLFTQDVLLRPGDRARLTVGVRFDSAGPRDTSRFAVQVNPVDRPDHERDRVPLPAHPFRVVPSLDRAVSLALTRVCGYDDAVKVEVVVTNTAAADLADFQLAVGPPHAVRAGALRKRESIFKSGTEMRFDLVVTGGEVEFHLAATIEGERVEGKRTLTVPTTGQTKSDTPVAFAFLEPRALTTDRVTLVPEGKGAEVTAAGGVLPVQGGKSRYVLTVFPSHPQATNVRLYAAAGQVEVEPLARVNRQWPYLITVVENPTLTQLVRMDYDVQVGGTPLRGEIYLSIRPTWKKAWTLAATAGLALTLKGGAALVTAAARSDVSLDELIGNWHELFERRGSELAQLACIPVIRGVLWLADRAWRPFQEG